MPNKFQKIKTPTGLQICYEFNAIKKKIKAA